MPHKKSKGFTLLEILLVVGIIAVLAGIVIIAINPSRQLKSVRDVQRKSDIAQINKAVIQFYIDYNYYPASTSRADSAQLTSTPTEICDTGDIAYPDTTTCAETEVNLSELVPVYLTAIPMDPEGAIAYLPFTKIAYAAGNGYRISKTSSNKIYVEAFNTELNGSAPGKIAYVGVPDSSYTIPDIGAASSTPEESDPIVEGLREGLIAYFSLDSDTLDYSGNGYDAIASGSPTSDSGKVGGAYSLSGSSQYLTTATLNEDVTSFSYALWIKPNFSGYQQPLIHWGTNPRNYVRFETATFIHQDTPYAGSLKIYWNGSLGCSDACGWNPSPSFSNGDWIYLVVTGTQDSGMNNQPMLIGSGGTTHTGKYISGVVDEVAVWNRILSVDEVSQLYNSGSGRSLVQ